MINLREIILGALMDIVEEEQYSHIVLNYTVYLLRSVTYC